MKLFELFATLSLDTDEFSRNVSNASGKAQGFASTIQQKVSSSTIAIGNLAAKGISTLVKYGVDSVKESVNVVKEYEQNLGGSEAVFGEWADEIQSKSQGAFKTMGLSMSDYLSTANKMGSLFKGAGFETSEAMDMTAAAMQRASDVASIMGIDAEWAMESIAGLAKGNFTMMDNLGVAINETTLANYALEKGIKKSIRSMTTQEKIGLALELFMERTAEYAGNYAKENTTLAGSYEVLSAAWENMLIGGEGSVDDFVWAMENAAKVTFDNLSVIVPRLGKSMWTAIKTAEPKIKAAFVDFWDNELPTVVTNGANLIIDGINTVFGTNIPQIETIELPTWEEFQTTATTWWEGIKSSLSSLASGFTLVVGIDTSNTENLQAFSGDIEAFGTDLISTFTTLQTKTSGFITAVKELTGIDLSGLIPTDAATGMESLGTAAGVVFSMWNPLLSLFNTIVNNWTSIKEAVGSGIAAVQNFFSLTPSEMWSTTQNKIVDFWANVDSVIQSAISSAKEFLTLSLYSGEYDWYLGEAEGASTHESSGETRKGGGVGGVGGFSTGLDYVPYDEFRARLHEGEAVLTKAEATEWRKNGLGGSVSAGIDYTLLSETLVAALSGVSINMGRKQVGTLVSPTVSKEINRQAKARRYGG